MTADLRAACSAAVKTIHRSVPTQRKVVKYNQLVANLSILHNVEAMTGTLKEMQREG
ncbi:hypothetical protein GTP56_17220 [Duganella sp. FT134W]|uniref:Uncharacterized protein n=1 Tax=Duganella margarita TaxID=2692170 RepID=A0A7X4KHY0_9BURK|nr:hypothetical protein [Duganella margarita]